jgi:hypothetical protein
MDTSYSSFGQHFLKITGAKYRQKCFPDFTTVEKSVLSILDTKKGASDHMKLLRKSGQLSNVVIFKAPCQIGGENSHATDPGKTEGSHFIKTKNCDSMPSTDRGSKGGKAGLGKPKGGSTECYVTEKVNPFDKTPLSEKGSRFANTKNKAAAQLVFEGAVPSYSTCVVYMYSWTKEANGNDLKMTFIQGKKRAKGRLWKLIIVAEEPEGITAVDDEMYKDMSAQVRKSDALAKERGLSH